MASPLLLLSLILSLTSIPISLVNAEYIVIYTLAASGHVNPMIPLAKELKERGHRVAFTFFDDDAHYLNGYDFPLISLGPNSPTNKTQAEEMDAYVCQNPTDGSALANSVKNFMEHYGPVFTTYMKMFEELRPDLVLTDQLGFPASDVAQKLGIPLVMMVHTMEMLTPILPAAPHLPAFLSGKLFVENPTYYEQIENMLSPYINMLKMIPIFFTIQNKRSEYGIESDNVPYGQLIMPSVWGYEIPRPIPPNIELIGNIWPLEDKKKLWDSETARWLNAMDKPVLYVSLGSVVIISDTQIIELSEGLKIASQKLNIRVVWIIRKNQKGRETVIAQNTDPAMIRIHNWEDQRQILSHEKVFCFLSHGGQNSISESLARGKPLIIMPFFGDQTSNAALVIYSGTGIKLLSQGLTRNGVMESINNMYDNKEKYTKGAQRIAKLMKDAGGVKRGADIVEQTMRFGVSHIVPPKDNTALWIKALPHVLLSLVLSFLFKFGKFVIGLFFSNSQKKVKTN